MKEREFKALLLEQLNDIICIESESEPVIKHLKKVSEDETLKELIDSQNKTSKHNLERLEKELSKLGIAMANTNCNSLKAVIESTHNYLNGNTINDFGILSHLDRINSYKIAVYKSAVKFSKLLGYHSLNITLQKITNTSYDLFDKLRQLDDQKSDEIAINSI